MCSSAVIRRRRLLATVVLCGFAASAFAAGLDSAGGEQAEAAPDFAQQSPSAAESGWQRALASQYDDYGEALACGGLLRPGRLGVASRTLPCGTLVTLAYQGRMVRVPVIDRGPYIEGRTWDLTAATAEALDFPGLAIVTWRR